VALGGYGRGDLAPRSDIDLLLLHQGAEVAQLAERVLYPLWDAAVPVGHAVRTVRESVEAAERLDVACSMLDARFLAGDQALVAELRERLLELLQADARGFLARLVEDAERRRGRYGSVSHLLEPDLKEGSGGLRDLHSLRWAAAVSLDRGLFEVTPPEDGLDRLVEGGALRSTERQALAAAQEYLTRLRSALHLETGRRTDRLQLENQVSLAAALGFEDQPGLAAEDALMRATFEHARRVEHVARAVFDRLRGRDQDPRSEGDAGMAGGAARSSATDLLLLFAHAAEASRPLSAGELDRVESAPLAEEIPWTEGDRNAFLRILATGASAAGALEALDQVGLLSRFIPEWEPVRCRPQRDPYHRFTVDVHLIQTLVGVGRLVEEAGGADPVAKAAVALVDDPDGLRLGALLHDIGKTGLGRHVPLGVDAARSVLGRMGVEGPTGALALFLVQHHLLLSDTATRRDLQDDDLILSVAAKVGDPGRLAALYLLTVADGLATGPHAWTAWRAALVRELVAKVERVLERGDMGSEAAERLAALESEIRAALAAEDPRAVDRHLDRMPRSYLLAVSADRAARDYRLVASALGATEVRSAAGPGERPGTYALTVVSLDRPGLLAWIAGSLSLSGLSILSAQVFTTDDGVAVDHFEVQGAFEPEVGEDRWRRFRTTLRHAVEGRVSLDHGVREKRAHYPPPRADIPVRVTVDNRGSDFFTIIEVGAPDRIGLLFDITRTLYELGLDVHLAKVATYGARVVDVFYVRDTLGRKVEEPADRTQVEQAILERVSF
jgi:[protein-PII] uridylyltransferase